MSSPVAAKLLGTRMSGVAAINAAASEASCDGRDVGCAADERFERMDVRDFRLLDLMALSSLSTVRTQRRLVRGAADLSFEEPGWRLDRTKTVVARV